LLKRSLVPTSPIAGDQRADQLFDLILLSFQNFPVDSSRACKISVFCPIKGDALETNVIDMAAAMQQPVKTMHTFHIGATRYVYVDEDNDVTICDQETGKRAFFTAQ